MYNPSRPLPKMAQPRNPYLERQRAEARQEQEDLAHIRDIAYNPAYLADATTLQKAGLVAASILLGIGLSTPVIAHEQPAPATATQQA